MYSLEELYNLSWVELCFPKAILVFTALVLIECCFYSGHSTFNVSTGSEASFILHKPLLKRITGIRITLDSSEMYTCV